MSKLSNVGGLFKNGKTLGVIMATIISVVLVLVIALYLTNRPAPPLPAEVRGAQLQEQRSTEERQLGEMDPRYREMFDRQNELQARAAEETGRSAMARIADDPIPTTPAPEPSRYQAPRNQPPQMQQRQAVPSQQRQAGQVHPALAELIGNRWQPASHVVHVSRDPIELQAEDPEPAADEDAPIKVYYKPGDIVAATLANRLDSDNPGPVVAVLQSGAHVGARLIGTAASGDNGVGVTAVFTELVTSDGTIYPISAQAMSEKDLSTLLATHTDYKRFHRFVFRPLAHFAKGMSEAILANIGTGDTTVDEGSGLTTITNNKLSTAEQVKAAVGIAAGEMINDVDDPKKIRPTTTVERNAVFGVLFLSRVDDSMAK